jgi:hypothetical protein
VVEGAAIAPDEPVEFDWNQRRNGSDGQLERAVESIRSDGQCAPVELIRLSPRGRDIVLVTLMTRRLSVVLKELRTSAPITCVRLPKLEVADHYGAAERAALFLSCVRLPASTPCSNISPQRQSVSQRSESGSFCIQSLWPNPLRTAAPPDPGHGCLPRAGRYVDNRVGNFVPTEDARPSTKLRIVDNPDA